MSASESEKFPEYSVWLKEAIKAAGLSQNALGRLVVDPVSHMAVSHWVNDQAVPHDRTQDRIEQVLGRVYPGPRPKQLREPAAPSWPEEVRKQGVLLRRIAEHLGVSTEDL